MADAPVFRATITAVDNATATLDRIGRKINAIGDQARRDAAAIWTIPPAPHRSFMDAIGPAANARFARKAMEEEGQRLAESVWKMPEPRMDWLQHLGGRFAEARAQVGEFGHALHEHIEPHIERVHRLHEAVSELGEGFGHVREMITDILTPLAAFGSVASVAGLFELVHGVAERSGEMEHAAASLAMTRGQLALLRYEAKQTDTPIESMETAMGKLGKAIGGAAAGKNKDALNLFAHLRIPLKDANGHLRTAIDALPQLQEAFQHTTDATMRQRMAFALFGRGGLDMMGMMMLTGEETERLAARLKSLGYRMSGEDKKGLEEYKSNWIDLGTAVNAFTNQLGAGLAPVLTPIIEKMTAFIGAHRADVVERFTGAIRGMSDWLYSVDWDGLGAKVMGYVRPIKDLWDKYGSLELAIWSVIFVITGPWVAAALSIVASMLKIGWGVSRLAWGFGTELGRAIAVASGAMEGFNAVLMRSPIWRTVTALLQLKDLATGKVQGRMATPEERERLSTWDPDGPNLVGRTWNKFWHNLGFGSDAPEPRARRGAMGVLLDQALNLPAMAFPVPAMPGVPSGALDRSDIPNPFAGLFALTRIWTESLISQHAVDAAPHDAPALPGPIGAPSPINLAALLAQGGVQADRDAGVEVRLSFDNLPSGASVTTTSWGPVRLRTPDVGRAMPETGPAEDNPLLHLNPANPFR